MADEQKPTGGSQNEGEGNKTAARQYNEAQERFAQSGKVEEKAREAERALDGPEKAALQHAEDVGRSHIAERSSKAMAATASRAGGKTNDVLNDVEDMIRRDPLLSVIIAAVLGYAWARFRR